MTENELLVAKLFLDDLSCKSKCNEIETLKEVLEEIQQFRKEGITIQKALDTMCDLAAGAEDLIEQYRAIGTVEERRTAVERMKAMSTNENMITISLYFEVYDADLYGGEGTVGYANTNVDLKVSALGKADIDNYVESQIQGVAEMCKVDKEKVIVISRTKYEEETADEDEWDDFDDDWSK